MLIWVILGFIPFAMLGAALFRLEGAAHRRDGARELRSEPGVAYAAHDDLTPQLEEMLKAYNSRRAGTSQAVPAPVPKAAPRAPRPPSRRDPVGSSPGSPTFRPLG